MKNVGVYIAIVTIGAAGAATAAGQIQRCDQAVVGDELSGPAPRNLAFPSFCDIPAAPKSVRAPAVFKSDVVNVRLAGRDLDTETGPDSWSLTGTGDFAATAAREVEPPPPMSSPGPGEVEAFVKQSQALATPPPRHRRPRH